MTELFDAQLLLETLDQVGDAVVVLDHDARIRFVNVAARDQFDLDVEQMLGLRLPECLPELGEEPFRDTYLEAVRSHRSQPLRVFVRATQRWYDGEITPGAHTTTVAFRDVTDRVRLELRDRLRAEVPQAVVASSSATLTDTLTAVVRSVREVVGYEFAELWLVADPEQTPELVTVDHEGHLRLSTFADATGQLALPPSSRVSTAAREARPVVSDDLASGGFSRTAEAGEAGLRGAVHLPVPLGGAQAVLGWFHAGDAAAHDRATVITSLHRHLIDLVAREMARQDLDRVFTLSRDLVAITDLEGRFVRVNPAWEDTLGWTPEQLVGRRYDEFAHPDHLDDLPADVEGLVTSRATREFEHRFRAADGTYRTLLSSSTAVPEYRAIYSNARDITDHVAREAYEQAQREVLVAIALNDPITDTLAHLAHMLQTRLTGTTASVLLVSRDGTRLYDAAAPSLPQAFREAVDGLEVGEVGTCGTAVARRRTTVAADLRTDPAWAPFRALAEDHGLRASWSVPFFDGEGAVLGTVAVYRDRPGPPLGEELQLVEDLAPLAGLAVMRSRDEEQLRDREQRFELLARATSDAVWDWDLATDQVWWGGGVRLLFGHDPAAIRAAGQPWGYLIHPDDLHHVAAAFDDRFHHRDGDGATVEYRFRRADGTYAHVADRFYVVRDEDGHPVRALGGMTDLSERRRFETEYLRAQRMESLGSLAGGIAHDLNNVLTPIVMATDLLGLTDLDAEQRDVLTTLSDSARRGAEMVQQVLRFARGDQPRHGGVDVRALLDELRRMTREWFGKDLRLHTEVADGVIAVRGDATQLQQVLINLALNARDAMPHGGTLTIEVGEVTLTERRRELPLPPGRYVAIAVGDEGTGMSPEVVTQLFDPFFTTKRAGTGLGLPTCRSIVQNHAGHLQVTTEPGRGSTFTAWLPAASAADTAVAPSSPPRRGRGETVLVADDEAAVREITRQALESYDYQVVTARDGPEALAVLGSADPPLDLVLMDLSMPLDDGRTPTPAQLRDLSPTTRIVATSGHSPATGTPTDSAGEVDGYLGKPYGSDRLLRTVRHVLDG